MTAGQTTVGRLTCCQQCEGGNEQRPEGHEVLSNPGLRSGSRRAVVVVGTEGRREKGPYVKVVLLAALASHLKVLISLRDRVLFFDPREPRSARVQAEARDTCGLSQRPDEGDHQGCGVAHPPSSVWPDQALEGGAPCSSAWTARTASRITSGAGIRSLR